MIEIFETLYFVSLKTEELQPITCYIVYLSPTNPDPKPPDYPPEDRWEYIRFEKPILFNTSEIVKIAKASDPRTSSFAIYRDTNGHPYIWGIIDQANSYHDFINYDLNTGPERPGIFQASILGIGHIATYIGYEKIAELKAHSLIGKTLDVLSKGPIYKKLKPGIFKFYKEVNDVVLGDRRYGGNEMLTLHWISSLCRLLLRVQNYRHGGAILITPDMSLQGLNVKYSIQYNRLQSALTERSIADFRQFITDDITTEEYVDRDVDMMPIGLHLDHVVQGYTLGLHFSLG